MPLTLRARTTIRLPAEFPSLRPDRARGRSAAEIARTEAQIGREKVEIGELFIVEGDAEDGKIFIEGDLRQVHRLGEGMISGALLVDGDVGERLGAGMIGGSIEINGSTGDWAAVGMRGGLLRIRQNAGDHLASGEPGERIGMRDGEVLVHGNVGKLAAARMRAGLVAVLGSIGEDCARGMIAGTLFGFGSIGQRAGSGMKRGTIGVFQAEGFTPQPTFTLSTFFRPVFATIYLKHLRMLDFPVAETLDRAGFRKYNGDRLNEGQGEILVVDKSA